MSAPTVEAPASKTVRELTDRQASLRDERDRVMNAKDAAARRLAALALADAPETDLAPIRDEQRRAEARERELSGALELLDSELRDAEAAEHDAAFRAATARLKRANAAGHAARLTQHASILAAFQASFLPEQNVVDAADADARAAYADVLRLSGRTIRDDGRWEPPAVFQSSEREYILAYAEIVAQLVRFGHHAASRPSPLELPSP
jgi:hypothetical protein